MTRLTCLALAVIIAMPVLAEGQPPLPDPEPPRVERAEDGDSITTPHQSRAWDICCPLPNGQTLIKVAGNLDALRPLAVLQCMAVAAERATCTERQQELNRK